MVNARRIAEALGGPQTLFGRRGRGITVERLQERVREGLPYAALEAVATAYAIPMVQLMPVLNIPPRTLARRKRAKRLQPIESDRLFRLGRIAAFAEEVLGSRAKATHWLRAPNRALGGAVPLRQLDTDVGATQVEALLLRVAHGVYS